MVSNIWARVYQRRRVLLIVGGAISLYIALCVYQINAASIWFDEAYSAWIIDLNPLRILSATAADVHPPLYYLLLQVWSFFAGSSETALRFLSTLFGAVTVGLTYIIARKFIGVKYAVFIPYVVALSPMLVRYGREARMYTLFVLFIVASLCIVLYAKRADKRLWRIHGVLVGLGILTHYFTFLYFIAQWSWVSWQSFRSGERHFYKILWPSYWKTSCLAALIVTAAWLPLMLQTALVRQVDGFWIPPVTLERIGNTVTQMFAYEVISNLPIWQLLLTTFLVIGTSITGVIFWTKYRNKKSESTLGVLVFSAVVPPLLLLLISLPPLVSKYYDRYLLPSMIVGLICISLLYAKMFMHTKKRVRFLAGLFAAIYIVLSTAGIFSVYHKGNYNEFDGTTSVRQVIESIERIDRTSPIYVINPGVVLSAQYYTERDNLHIETPFIKSNGIMWTYNGEGMRLAMERVQRDRKGDTIWIIDHVRLVEKNVDRPIIWPYVPVGWTRQQVIEYDYADTEPSYRAVRYTVQ